jgi:hypothetical protein
MTVVSAGKFALYTRLKFNVKKTLRNVLTLLRTSPQGVVCQAYRFDLAVTKISAQRPHLLQNVSVIGANCV